MGLARDLLELVIVGAGPAGIALGAETVTSGIDPSRVLVLEKGEAHSFSIRTLDPNGAPMAGHSRTAVCAGVLSGPGPAALKERVAYDVAFQASGREDVLVVGGGDLAAEFAQYLAQEGHRVVLSYRGIAFRRMNEINRASIEELERNGRLCILRGSNVSEVEAEAGKARVLFADQSAPPLLVDRIVLALGGAPPENTLRTIGIDFDGAQPVLREGYETSIQGLYLVGDLTAGKSGGSIITAFNSAGDAIRALIGRHAERTRLAS